MIRHILRYLIFITGLYFLSAGIVLILHSSLGTTPISSVNYVMSLNTSLSLGAWTFIINMLLILGQFWFIKDCSTKRDVIQILLQMPFSFIFAFFIDLNMTLTQDLQPNTYLMCLAILLAGCFIQALGVVLEIKPNVVMMSGEGFVNYASKRYNKDFGKTKVKFDVTLVIIAVGLSLLITRSIEGVREVTVISAVISGYIVSFLNNKILTKSMLNRVASFGRIKRI